VQRALKMIIQTGKQ